MNWITRWIANRRIEKLRKRISHMKLCAEAVEADLRMPTVETISGRILRERIVVLEKAVELIDAQSSSVGK